MNKTLNVIYEEVAEVTGLSIDEKTETLIGVCNGYHLTIGLKDNVYVMYASARKNGSLPDKEFTKEARKAIEGVRSVTIQGNNIAVWIAGASKNKVIANMIAAINGATEYFRANGYEDVCECCGKPMDSINVYNISGGISFLCEDCYAKINQSLKEAQFDEENTEENVLGGFFGALCGSIVGAIVIVIVAQLGYVAVLSGIVMGVTTIYGYEKLGKKLSGKGVAISALVMIAMVFVAEIVQWNIVFSREIGIDFFDGLSIFGTFLGDGEIKTDFIISLMESYAFTALGAIPAVYSSLKKRKVAYDAYQIQ
ncbi:MAG: hypothetical protein VZR53_18455 [Prevotella sp.]|nr:hypothetical protein [Prevotella sp.]